YNSLIYSRHTFLKNYSLEIMKALSNLALTTRHSAIISCQKYLVSLYTFKKRLRQYRKEYISLKAESKNLFSKCSDGVYNIAVLIHLYNNLQKELMMPE